MTLKKWIDNTTRLLISKKQQKTMRSYAKRTHFNPHWITSEYCWSARNNRREASVIWIPFLISVTYSAHKCDYSHTLKWKQKTKCMGSTRVELKYELHTKLDLIPLFCRLPKTLLFGFACITHSGWKLTMATGHACFPSPVPNSAEWWCPSIPPLHCAEFFE